MHKYSTGNGQLVQKTHSIWVHIFVLFSLVCAEPAWGQNIKINTKSKSACALPSSLRKGKCVRIIGKKKFVPHTRVISPKDFKNSSVSIGSSSTQVVKTNKSASFNPTEYCADRQKAANDLLTQPSPSEYIKKSPNKVYLELWKQLFLRLNGISEDYFNSHIRIKNDDYHTDDYKYFEVNFHYVLDWISVPERNRFTLDRSIEDIKKLFTKSGYPIVTELDTKYYRLNFISDNLRVNGKLVVNPASCQTVLQKLTDKDKTLIPVASPYFTGEFFLFDANSEKTDCQNYSMPPYGYEKFAIINLIGGNLFYYSDKPCPTH